MNGQRSRATVSRRTFARLLAAGLGALLSADGVPIGAERPLPIGVNDDDTARYLRALTDLPPPAWTHLAITAAILDPGPNALRPLLARLPGGVARTTAFDWTYRADARRVSGILARIERLYAALLPPDRARAHAILLQAERRRLARGGQVDYSGLLHLVTQINREQGLMARPELDDLLLVRAHHLDPAAQPRDVAALLVERRERRDLAAAFRAEVARLLGGAPVRLIAAAGGPLTLLADLGRPTSAAPATYQLIPAQLPDLGDATIAERPAYFTAGDFLGFEPAAPLDRWANNLPAEQRADAPANALSPRLSRKQILAPAYASRVLWATAQECRVVVATLRAL